MWIEPLFRSFWWQHLECDQCLQPVAVAQQRVQSFPQFRRKVLERLAVPPDEFFEAPRVERMDNGEDVFLGERAEVNLEVSQLGVGAEID